MCTRTISTCILALLLTACEQPSACPECDDEEPFPDLACGGADLDTDDLNCGACGNECLIQDKGTQYETGNCEQGRCGPTWHSVQLGSVGLGEEPAEVSCEQQCAAAARSCVTRGCSGKTGYICSIFGFEGISCDFSEPNQWWPADWTGSCTEAVSWPTYIDSGAIPVLACCCE